MNSTVSGILLLVLLTCASGHAQTQSVPARERDILMELYAATKGELWTRRDDWGSARPVCYWYGVNCDYLDGDERRPVVASLDLSSNNLVGTLPPSLAELEHFKELRVGGNRLAGKVPDRFLELWDKHLFEFDGVRNSFDGFVERASVVYSSSNVLCAQFTDLRYQMTFEESSGRATFQSVRCVDAKSRRTYCLVREGSISSLGRLSRALSALQYHNLAHTHEDPFTFTTDAEYLTTTAQWADGSQHAVETYNRAGPREVWISQQLFLSLLAQASWERESRKPRCDFQDSPSATP
jgi:hypothetical protein